MRYLVLAAVTAVFLVSAGAAAAMPGSPDGSVPTPAPAPAPPPSLGSLPGSSSPGSSSPGYVNSVGTDGTASGTSTSPTTTTTWPSGCRTVDVFAEQRSFLFHVRIYRFHQIKHWCWRNGIVYDERHAWSFDGSATACLDTVYPDNSWYFTWWHGKANSGHFSEERAHATNCVFHIGDWKEFYPDVKIWAYADGTYKVSTGN